MFANKDLVMAHCWVVFFVSKNSFFHPFARSCLVENGSLWWPKVVLTHWNVFWFSLWGNIWFASKSPKLTRLFAFPTLHFAPECISCNCAQKEVCTLISHSSKSPTYLLYNCLLYPSDGAQFLSLFLSPTFPLFFSKFLWALNTLLCRWHFSCSSLLFLQWKLQWKLWEMAMLHLVH